MSDLGRDEIGGQNDGSTLLEEQIQNVEPGDHERNSHYVRKEKILESAVLGSPVIALCGKVWVPGRDPEKFPVCPTCKEIYEGLRPEDPKSANPDK
jgi:glutaredoxin